MFSKQQPITLRMTTPEMTALHELYASRLLFDEQYIKGISEGWIQKINTLTDSAQNILERLSHNETEINKAAERMLKRFATKSDNAQQIVNDKRAIYMERLRKEAQLELKLARSQAMLHEETKRHAVFIYLTYLCMRREGMKPYEGAKLHKERI